jgi:hypothetical protein
LKLFKASEAGKAGSAGKACAPARGAWSAAACATLLWSLTLVAASSAVDAAFKLFWETHTPQDAAAAVDAVTKSHVGFDAAYGRLKHGRPYASDVPRGVVRLSHRLVATDFPYTLDVPPNYDPAKKYQVRVQLHGGVNRPDPAPRGNGIGPLAGAEQIYVLPTAWADAEWWTDRQLESLRTILDRLKRTYNVDENRIVVSGVSDGGTAAYYFAMRDTTLFASFLPLNGAMAVLRSASIDLDGELFPNNLLNKPLFVVNGGRDPLYPASLVEPFIEHLSKGGVDLKYLPQAEGVHNTAWWPEVKDTFESFAESHPRRPLPDKLTWESDLTAGTNRAHWLVIDTLASPRADGSPLPDLNDFNTGPAPNFGLRAAGSRITSVAEGSNASAFGFLPGDIVTSINGNAIPSGSDLLQVLSTHEPRKMMKFVVSRDNKPVELSSFFATEPRARVVPLFSHAAPSGRVDLVKEGNTVRATTRGVETFTLLLSPDAFDFSRPITVVANGKTTFEGRQTKSLATLMKWAARDNDRTALFGAELHLRISR